MSSRARGSSRLDARDHQAGAPTPSPRAKLLIIIGGVVTVIGLIGVSAYTL